MKKIHIDLNDINNMVKECVKRILNEGITSIVYHYTHPDSLLSIIKNNELRLSDDCQIPDGTISRGGLSVTRQRNDRIGYAVAFRHEFFDGCYVRLQLDGDLLSCNYKGKPVDEFGARGDMNIRDWDYDSRLPFRTQAEDRIFTKNDEPIKNAIKYITRIDIMFPTYDSRYDSYQYEIEEFLNNLVNIALNTEWENKIYLYFDDEFQSNRNDFNFQTNNYCTLKDMAGYLMNEGKEMNYDILYRGINNKQKYDAIGTWLTTSKSYASTYGDVKPYKIPIKTLDMLANEKEALQYLINDNDEYPFYTPYYFNLKKMKQDGYTGYYYYEAEYKCLNVYLFK